MLFHRSCVFYFCSFHIRAAKQIYTFSNWRDILVYKIIYLKNMIISLFVVNVSYNILFSRNRNSLLSLDMSNMRKEFRIMCILFIGYLIIAKSLCYLKWNCKIIRFKFCINWVNVVYDILRVQFEQTVYVASNCSIQLVNLGIDVTMHFNFAWCKSNPPLFCRRYKIKLMNFLKILGKNSKSSLFVLFNKIDGSKQLNGNLRV